MLGKAYQTYQKCWEKRTRRNRNVDKGVPDVPELLGKITRCNINVGKDVPNVTEMLGNAHQM